MELVASGRLSASALDWPCPTSGWWRVQVGNTSAHELRTGMLQVSRVSMAPAKARGAAQSGVVYAQWEPYTLGSWRLWGLPTYAQSGIHEEQWHVGKQS